MNESERILERIWTEFLVKTIKPDIPTDQLKYIADVFQWGAMLMAREIFQEQNNLFFKINEELKIFASELKGEERNETPN